jgi:hypothetical protein
MDSEGDETKAVRVEGGVSGPRPITFRCLRRSHENRGARFARNALKSAHADRFNPKTSPTYDWPTLQTPRVARTEVRD